MMLTIMTLSFGMDFNMALAPYGALWRRSRRELQASFRTTDVESYQPLEQRAVHGLLRNLLSSPDNFEQHLRQ
jgi:cytochrome P450